ncbi:MAG: SoxR reducing system RseC family protein [Methylococcales bacterium]
MLEESAIVVKIDNGQVWVVGTQNNACAGCAQKAGCSSNALDSVLKKKPILVDSELALKMGDTVVVVIEEGELLRAAFFMYLLPVCALFIGAGITDSVVSAATPYADLWIAGGALTGLALAFLVMQKIQKYALLNYYARPVVIKKC